VKPNERYSLRLCILMVVKPLLLMLGCLAISYYYSALTFWKNPTDRQALQGILQNPHMRGHAQVIAVVLSIAVFLVVILPLFLTLIGFVIKFPRYYFWNRRAARIACEESNHAAVADTLVENATSWPPPPKRTVS